MARPFPSALFFLSLGAVAQSDTLRVVWPIALRLVVPKIRKTEAVAVLRIYGGQCFMAFRPVDRFPSITPAAV